MKTDLSACSVGDNPWIPPAELECGCDRCLEAYERPNYPSAKRQQALRIFERDDMVCAYCGVTGLCEETRL